MPLIDLKTNLKSLKYGSDRIGGGNSGQPYIQTNIGEGIIGNVDDGLIRGGGAGAIKSAAVDTLRIGKFLADNPRGYLFIKKQVGLQLSNPLLENKAANTGIGFLNRIVDFAKNEIGLQPTRIYNLGVNTLAQVPANVIGLHLNRHGLGPIQDDSTKYLAVVKFNDAKGTNGKNNRLVKYTKDLIPNSQPTTVNRILNAVRSVLAAVPGLPSFLRPTDQKPIAEYIGGPGSVYGIGRTLIKRYDYTSNGLNKQFPIDRGKLNRNILGVTNQYNEGNVATLANVVSNALLGIGINVPININNLINPENSFSQINQTSVNYPATDNIPAGANGTVDSPTARKYTTLRNQITKQSNLKQNIFNGLNKTNVFKTQNPNINRGAKNSAYLGTNLAGNRLRKTNAFDRYDANILSIVFRLINPFKSTPESILFPAYLKGFRDNFDATWNETNYVGRSESFYIYNKFKRSVTFNLDIPCFNQNELFANYKSLGILASTTAGSYDNNFLGGVLMQLNVGNHIKGEYAILTNLSYEIPDESSWDIDAQLAMYIKATFSFNIIQSNLPQYQANQGFYNHVDRFGIFTKTNNIIGKQKNKEELTKYFTTEPDLIKESAILQKQSRNLINQVLANNPVPEPPPPPGV